MDSLRSDPVVDVVFVGADIGVYAMARAFHERTGRRSTSVTGNSLAAVTYSSILDIVPLVDAFDEQEVVATLTSIGRQGSRPLILLTNSDHFTGIIARHEEALRQFYFLPAPSKETIDLVADKTSFMSICTGLGIRVPTGIAVDLRSPDWEPPSLEGFTFPVVAKPAVSAEYADVNFVGKKKIYMLDNADEVNALWKTLRSAGYPGSFLLQDYIPGGDDAIRSVTAYVDGSGVVTMECAAQVLLEECAPHKLGIPAAMITVVDQALFDGVERFLSAVNYRGFANFDAKIDPRNGEPVFFEVNTRIGRNNFYVTAAGVNVMDPVLDDVAGRHDGVTRVPERAILYTTVPLLLLKRFVADPALWQLVKTFKRQEIARPLIYRGDRSARQRVNAWLVEWAQWRAYWRFGRHAS